MTIYVEFYPEDNTLARISNIEFKAQPNRWVGAVLLNGPQYIEPEVCDIINGEKELATGYYNYHTGEFQENPDLEDEHWFNNFNLADNISKVKQIGVFENSECISIYHIPFDDTSIEEIEGWNEEIDGDWDE